MKTSKEQLGTDPAVFLYSCRKAHNIILGLIIWERISMKYAYRNGIILDGTENMEPLTGTAVLTDGEIIENLVKDYEVPSEYEIVDLQGGYLLPGLINLHVHLATSGKPPKSSEKQTDYTKLYQLLTSGTLIQAGAKKVLEGYLKTELLSGVTTIRTVGGVLDFDARLRDEVNHGKLTGPRMYVSNMAISVPGGHFAGSIATVSSSVEEVVADVRKIAETHPDLIKLMITGGVMDSSDEGEPGVLRMPAEYVKAACEEAHKLGFKVAAHVEGTEGLRTALENGVDSIEHGAHTDPEIVRLFQERGAVEVCTFSPFIPYALFDISESHCVPAAVKNGQIVIDGIVECTKTCLANGIPVGLGSDVGCPFIVHYNFWRELCYFRKYIGVSNRETLYTATLNNAKILGADHITGSIEKGKSADMIIVRRNPLEDLRALRDVSMVIFRGKQHRKPKVKKMKEIDTLLDKYM